MKRRHKLGLLAVGLMAVTFVASSCTANFATNIEKSRIAYVIEPGVSTFTVVEPEEKTDYTYHLEGSSVWQIVNVDENFKYQNSTLNSIISSAKNGAISAPTVQYFAAIDKEVLNLALGAYTDAEEKTYTIASADLTDDIIKDALTQNGYLKFYQAESKSNWKGFDEIHNKVKADLGYDNAASTDFIKVYKQGLNQIVDKYRSSITTIPGEYGNYGDNKQPIHLDGVTWGDAWGKGGHVIEGLIVFPVAWLVDTFANLFAHGNPSNYMNGVPQILSLLLVTVIVRLFIFLVTIKSTLSQQKIQEIQPELTKIQQKYPNANTSQTEKQRLAEEQMRLYKKNKINPLAPFLTLIVQFPVFIGVWGAMTGSAVLSTGAFLNLDLSQSIWEALKMGPANHPGWWTALVLIILMSAGQFFSMKVPQWIQKAKAKKVARLSKNPAEKSQNKTANIISYVMLVMIIVMGFTLPAAMGVYWFIGALVSLTQTLIMQLFTNKKKHK